MGKNGYPRISIITCTYNSEKYLEKALESVETQTYTNIEHIFNDSYSTDRTLDIIQAYTERNKNLYTITFTQSPAKGVANALNVASRQATGDIVHYLHGDDYYDTKDSLERAAAYFAADPNLVWLTGNFLVEVGDTKVAIPQTYLLKINPEKVISAMNIIHHENTFVRREVIEKYGGFSEDKNDVVEYGLWLRLIKDYKPLIVNESFTVFIIHKDSTSTGNIILFSKAILRAFHTQHKEKVFPFIGYYADSAFYKNYKKIVQKVLELKSLVDCDLFGE